MREVYKQVIGELENNENFQSNLAWDEMNPGKDNTLKEVKDPTRKTWFMKDQGVQPSS